MTHNRMGGIVFASAALVSVAAIPAPAQRSAEHALSTNGWTVTADAAHETVAVAHNKLGVLLTAGRLAVRNEGGVTQPASQWTVTIAGPASISIRTAQPHSAWLFEATPDALKISCTSYTAVFTGHAPAPPNRVIARLLDPEGAPIEWKGTAEVKGTYGGTETINPSFLPRRNADVMYLGLGQVSASTLHGLFDRKTDTAISFMDDTTLERSRANPDTLDVTMPVPGNTVVRLIPDYYTRRLGVPFYAPFDDSVYPRAPIVWSSWTSYYADITEADIVRNTDWLAENLKPYGFEFVQLDDGYDRVGAKGEHSWIEDWNKTKFPHGPAWLASYIKSKGLRAGLWIVPNAYAGAVAQHPDWYLRDKKGDLILDYNTPALDSTNPEVQAFLKRMFTTLDGWGFDYYKFDGEHALPKYAPVVDRRKLHDPSIDPVTAYRERLALIRGTLGPNRFIEGCPAGTPLNGIGYFNSYFNGDDLYNNWQGMYPLFSSINANVFLNHLLVYVMPGEGLEVGPPMSVEETLKKRHPSVVRIARTRETPLTGFGVTNAEARTLVTYLGLTGVVYPLASVMSELPEQRVRLLKMTMPPTPILPIDLFSRGTDMTWDRFKHVQADDYIHNYPELLDLKVNAASGAYDVVGMTNWRSWPVARELSFGDKLGLGAEASYIAFDFWNQKLLGVFRGGMRVDVPPHDTRVLLIRADQDHPQLAGISRHITGAYSVLKQTWDAPGKALNGDSQGIAGEPYALWIHVPDGWTVSGVKAATATGEIAADHKTDGNALMVRFEGQPAPVHWSVSFSGGAR